MGKPYLRIIASAILRRQGRVLMQHRSMDRKIAPGQWAIPGGHLEPGELREPARAALREVFEETGIRGEDLRGFGLRYVQLSTQPGELRLHFDYAADVAGEPRITANDEGTLHWVAPEEIPALDMRPSMRALMGHYLSNTDQRRVHMGFQREDGCQWLPTDAAPDAGFRPAAGTILRQGGQLLLLHRPMDKQLAPGMWANVGGHMEGEEIHDPQATALRELFEETGIPARDVTGHAFRGAMLVAKADEFGLLINYCGQIARRVCPPDTREDGEFRWIWPQDVPALPMTPAMRAVALHDAQDEPDALLGLARGQDIWRHAWVSP